MIVAVDGKRVRVDRRPAPRDRRAHRPGDAVRLTVRRDKGLRTVSVKTIADPQRPEARDHRRLSSSRRPTIKLPLTVTIDAGDVGGPSAGLAFALDLMESSARTSTTATGSPRPASSTSTARSAPIGGVKQKTIGARKAGVDIFLVPAGENAAEASRYADGLRIVPVKSFRQALRGLATLPKS